MKPSVLVTGGARRIGRRICETLASSGWNVIVHSRDENDSDAIALADSFSAARVWGDLSKSEDVKKLFSLASNISDNLSAIVNNASLFSVGPITAEDEEKMYRVNYSTPVLLTQLLFEKLKSSNKSGAVINLLDTRILSSAFKKTPYSKSKRELFDFTIQAAKNLSPVLRVNGVAPGPVLVPSAEGLSEKGGKILLSSRPTPDDVANAVQFLLNAKSVTGQIIAVDSGQHLISEEIVR